MAWVRRGRSHGGEAPQIARLRVLVEAAEAVPLWRAGVARALSHVLVGTSAIGLLETGLPNDRGLLEETADRLSRRLLPRPLDQEDLGELVERVFPKKRDAVWLAALPLELYARLAALIDPAAAGRLRAGLVDTVALLATRTAALGLSREVRARSNEGALVDSPFYLLPRACHDFHEGLGGAAHLGELAAGCREAAAAVLAHLEQHGVSVDVVYRLDVIERNLERIGELVGCVDPTVGSDACLTARRAILARLVAARVRDRSVRDVIRTNLRLLARKIIERVGDTGEHYITSTRREWWRMLASAGGGGALTAFTAALKFLIFSAHYPLFVEGTLASLNYAGSFLLMQLLGFTLATKQPSMTAAALAGAIHQSKDAQLQLDDLVTQIARICRSQLAAAIGNVCFVIPAAIAFNLIWARGHGGHDFLDAKSAEHMIESLHPTHSATIWFATITGVILWASSLAAGWLENWAIYRRLPEAIAQHRLGRWVGRRRMEWLAAKLRHHIAGFGGNVAIGVFLGMVPVFGKFLGLPLDVRHVTLSTGGLTLAACAVGPAKAITLGLWPAVLGIGVILALNFGVSFSLALGVAMRARGAERQGFRLLRAVIARALRSPGEFLLPPKVGTTFRSRSPSK